MGVFLIFFTLFSLLSGLFSSPLLPNAAAVREQFAAASKHLINSWRSADKFKIKMPSTHGNAERSARLLSNSHQRAQTEEAERDGGSGGKQRERKRRGH